MPWCWTRITLHPFSFTASSFAIKAERGRCGKRRPARYPRTGRCRPHRRVPLRRTTRCSRRCAHTPLPHRCRIHCRTSTSRRRHTHTHIARRRNSWAGNVCVFARSNCRKTTAEYNNFLYTAVGLGFRDTHSTKGAVRCRVCYRVLLVFTSASGSSNKSEQQALRYCTYIRYRKNFPRMTYNKRRYSSVDSCNLYPCLLRSCTLVAREETSMIAVNALP